MPALNIPRVTAGMIRSGAATAGHVLAADGAGGTEWVAPGGGAALQHNLDGAIEGAPGSTEDETEGWAVGSLWWQASTSKVWVCRDATEGAAVWSDLITTGYADAAYAGFGHGHEGYITVGGDPYQVPVSDGSGGYSWQAYSAYGHTHTVAEITDISSSYAPLEHSHELPSHEHDAAAITSGELPPQRGGTGLSVDPLYISDGAIFIGIGGSGFALNQITGTGGTTVTNSPGNIDVSS